MCGPEMLAKRMMKDYDDDSYATPTPPVAKKAAPVKLPKTPESKVGRVTSLTGKKPNKLAVKSNGIRKDPGLATGGLSKIGDSLNIPSSKKLI